MVTRVLLLGRMATAAVDYLTTELGDSACITSVPEPQAASEQSDMFEDADVIVGGPLTAETATRAKRLKLFHAFRGGTDGLGIEHLPPHVRVCNTFHHEVGVAEFAVMAMLMLARQVIRHDRQLREGNWRGSVMWGEPPEQTTLVGKTVLIVGIGHIGREIASRVRAFGARIIGVTRNTRREVACADQLVDFETWRDELPQADFVVASARLTSDTEGMFADEEFRRMKPSAFFINVARGTIAQERALYEALRDERIAGAAIDVWYNYPQRIDDVCLPSNEPLYELDNLLLSPNRSSWTREMLAMRSRDVAENIRRLSAGRELINCVR